MGRIWNVPSFEYISNIYIKTNKKIGVCVLVSYISAEQYAVAVMRPPCEQLGSLGFLGYTH